MEKPVEYVEKSAVLAAFDHIVESIEESGERCDPGRAQQMRKILEGALGCVRPADVAPVIHAHWDVKHEPPECSYMSLVCSHCGEEYVVECNNDPCMKRCIECGAIMDEEPPCNGGAE